MSPMNHLFHPRPGRRDVALGAREDYTTPA